MSGGKLRDLPGSGEGEPGCEVEECAGVSLSRRLEGPVDLARVSNLELRQLPSPRPGGRLARRGGVSTCIGGADLQVKSIALASRCGRRSTHSIQPLFGLSHAPRERDQQDLGEVGHFSTED